VFRSIVRRALQYIIYNYNKLLNNITTHLHRIYNYGGKYIYHLNYIDLSIINYIRHSTYII